MPVGHRIAHRASDARRRAHLSAAREAPHVGLGDAHDRGVVLVKAASHAGASVRVQHAVLAHDARLGTAVALARHHLLDARRVARDDAELQEHSDLAPTHEAHHDADVLGVYARGAEKLLRGFTHNLRVTADGAVHHALAHGTQREPAMLAAQRPRPESARPALQGYSICNSIGADAMGQCRVDGDADGGAITRLVWRATQGAGGSEADIIP